MTKEQKEAIEYIQKQIDYYKEQIKFIEAVDSDYYDEEYELYKNRIKQFETVLNMLKENSAELAEKSAEIEKKDKKDKIIDLMAERIEWLCKSNGILLDKEHDENFTQEDIKQYFERKVEMKEIKVGEYGRTNKGKIFIFAWLENSDGKRYTNKVLLGNGKIFENKFYYFDDGEEIVKHSKNIIDLVEVGDYVNGYKVITVDTDAPNNCKECIELDRNNAYEYQWISRNEIKTILTKELYQANCYTVERKEENESND